MIKVELRWLEKVEPAYRNEQTGLSLPELRERVLQYRELVPGAPVFGAWRDPEWEWSEWRDVPVVEG